LHHFKPLWSDEMTTDVSAASHLRPYRLFLEDV